MQKSKLVKRILRWTLLTVLITLVALNLFIVFTGRFYLYKAIWYTTADIDDYKIFENRSIAASSQPQAWAMASGYNKKSISPPLQKYLDSLGTVAFLIIRNDSIEYEKYYEGHSQKAYSNSFSVAKSFIATLIGIAQREGLIKNLNQSVGDFLPSFQKEGMKNITIRHLLWMSSGLKWDEGYANPLSVTTEAYYGSDLPKLVNALEPVEPSGKIFRYKSIDTQILCLVLEKATGKRVSVYAQEKLWQPLGFTENALWSLDKENGTEKAYCCIHSNARDFARLGKLYLQQGIWNNDTLLSPAFVKEATTPHLLPDGDLAMAPSDFYGFQWWTMPNYKGHYVYYARGILGQYIIVVPDEKLIIVRLGKRRGDREGKHFRETFMMLEEALSRK